LHHMGTSAQLLAGGNIRATDAWRWSWGSR